MIHLLVEYQVQEGTVTAALAVIDAFLTAIFEAEPDTAYVAYRVAGSDRFVHTMAFVDAAAQKRHQTAAYTQRFVTALYPLCVTPPRFSPLTRIEGAHEGVQ